MKKDEEGFYMTKKWMGLASDCGKYRLVGQCGLGAEKQQQRQNV